MRKDRMQNTVDSIQRNKALKTRTAPFVLFSILGLIFILSLVPSVYGADLSCPGGQWVLTSSCGSCTAPDCPDYRIQGIEIIGDTKYHAIQCTCFTYDTNCLNNICVAGNLCPSVPCSGYAPPSYGSLYLGWIDNCVRKLDIYEWQCPAVCTAGQTKACPYTGPAGTKDIGICKAGVQACVNGQWGPCEGEIKPQPEKSDGKDNNCNGQNSETGLGGSCTNIDTGSSAHPGSGNLYHDQTLFQTTASGFTLSYNSIDIYNGTLGKGWTHNWNLLLFSNPDSSIGLKQGDGNVIYFRLSNSIYHPKANSGDTSYITVNSDNTYTQTHKNNTTFNFNTLGKLTSIKDRNNNTTTLTYTGDNLTTITDPSGRTTYLTYDSQNKITSITDPAGRVYRLTYTGDHLTSVADPEWNTWQYTYNPNGMMLTKTDPKGYVTTYTYDANNKVISSTDPEGKTKAITYDPISQTAQATEKDGGVWTYKYDPLLNVTTQKTDPQGNITTYTYDQNKNLISERDAQGSTTSYTYDTNRNMTSVTDALGNTTTYTYNTFGQITSITDSENKITTYTYDTKGNLISTTDATGAITQYQYDTKGNITSITNPNGQATAFAYDQFNNLSSVTDSTGSTTTFTYDSSGNMTSQTDPNGNITRFEYNSLNQLIKITDPQNNITTYTYDKNGNKISQTDGNGNTTYYEYNYRNQLTKVTDSIGGVTTYTYGGTGCSSCGGGTDKLTAITDAKGQTTTYQYDLSGRLIKETDSLGKSVTYSYDTLGRLTSVTDTNGNATTYQYDSLGRVIRTESPETGITTYIYNSLGNILTKTDANSITVQYAYDSLNRLTNIQFPDTSENITYTYDNCTNGKGRLCSMTDPSGTTAYEYDSLGRTTRENKTILGINYTTAYEYDKTGSLTTITYPSGRKVKYTYNSVYRPTSVTQQLNHGKTSLASNMLYDKAGNMVSMTLGNGIAQQWTYDTKNRIHTITVPAIVALNYAYDPVGNITSIIDQYNPANIKTYTYDSLDRLTNATGPWVILNWTYDANGNRLAQSNNKTTLYTYEANRLTSVTTNNHSKYYQYDANGNTINDGKREFIYNQNNRLAQVVKKGTIAGQYVYDGKGRRSIKNTDTDDEDDDDDNEYDHCKVFHYDQTSTLIEETTCNGKLLVDYVYLNGNPLAMIRKQEHKDETFYYHNDHLGTPKTMTDKLKKVVWNIEFDPFGNEIGKRDTDDDEHGHNGRHGRYIRKVINNLRFKGQYYDRESGLHQNGFRDYNPAIGAYPQPDPIGLLGGMNPYSYGNNPVNWVDPWGLQATAIPTPAGPLPIILPPNSQYNKLTPQQWEAMQKDINSFLRLFDPRPLVNYLNEKLIPTIQVPSEPMTLPDLSNTPEACRLWYEGCKAEADIAECGEVKRTAKKALCWAKFLLCLTGTGL